MLVTCKQMIYSWAQRETQLLQPTCNSHRTDTSAQAAWLMRVMLPSCQACHIMQLELQCFTRQLQLLQLCPVSTILFRLTTISWFLFAEISESFWIWTLNNKHWETQLLLVDLQVFKTTNINRNTCPLMTNQWTSPIPHDQILNQRHY